MARDAKTSLQAAEVLAAAGLDEAARDATAREPAPRDPTTEVRIARVLRQTADFDGEERALRAISSQDSAHLGALHRLAQLALWVAPSLAEWALTSAAASARITQNTTAAWMNARAS